MNMSSRLNREECENFLMTAGLSAVIAVAQVLIENPLISSIVIGTSALAITAIFIRSRFGNYLFSYFNLKSSRQFHERSDIQHLLIHQTRDMCIKMMPSVPPYEAPPLVHGARVLPHPLLEFHRSKIISLLEKEARLFQTLVPEGTRVWTCIRDRRSDDHYHTFARAGLYNPHRTRDSQPLHKDNSRIISRLKDSYRDGRCVIITGIDAGPQVWERQENDKYGEDKSVMLGLVVQKTSMRLKLRKQ